MEVKLRVLIWCLLCILAFCSAQDDKRCKKREGTCQNTRRRCSGSYIRNLCPGGSNIRCCVPNSSGRDRQCTNRRGTCQHDSLPCSGTYESGLCSGGKRNRCCIPEFDCPGVKIYIREDWGAFPARSSPLFKNPGSYFFVHHTAGSTCYSFHECAARVRSTQLDHMDETKKNYSDIGYSFLVGQDGNVYEGRGWDKVGAHTFGYNDIGYAISFLGNFESMVPNAASLSAAKKFIACGVKSKYLNSSYTLLGHRDVKNTLCPGKELYKIIKNWPNYGQR